MRCRITCGGLRGDPPGVVGVTSLVDLVAVGELFRVIPVPRVQHLAGLRIDRGFLIDRLDDQVRLRRSG
jgi:hypothetical protein